MGKKQEISDHKFDNVDEREFIDRSIGSRLSYLGLFIITIKDIMVYIADLGSLGLLLSLNADALQRFGQPDVEFKFSTIPEFNNAVKKSDFIKGVGGLGVIFMLIIGSLGLSFVLLYLEWKKAFKVIESRDISYAFTSVVAYRFYAIRSYAHYCLFSQIRNSRKTVDILAFWVFFKFKGWKKLLLAQSPRQFLQGSILFSVYQQVRADQNLSPFGTIAFILNGNSFKSEAKLLMLLQIFTISIWLFTFTSLIVAFAIYIPLVPLKIRGNLKEYCVHKVDKRLDQILYKKSKKKLRELEKNGEYPEMVFTPVMPSYAYSV